MNWQENILIRECNYSDQKYEWKAVIKSQLIKHLKDIRVEPGLANSEACYLEITGKEYVSADIYEQTIRNYTAKMELE